MPSAAAAPSHSAADPSGLHPFAAQSAPELKRMSTDGGYGGGGVDGGGEDGQLRSQLK